ncbi:calmodulin-binding transcription activator 3-like isoform X1 [Tripterygium wilfordii]|uniref:Calmodulin-binding transcription activator 3-like isoform X1 n=1 Tax=Tripterygium wilfordii TaxID=458696 RepID=A0A7J7E0B5_TRIWF|nr:calmodulin-binding transcription activator 3-like isoform X1 [Tripterygium wilfordii]
MAENRRYITNQHLDLDQILQEAQYRWLRPVEICKILQNYQRFQLTHDPPDRPAGGSLFLFDRKVLRYFRKDGHCWRKKKDGKTVKEAHEKLKTGSVDVLHCYYAHGEDNEYFQRRCYWMLDGLLEHIVLVHYRDVKEKSSSGSRLLADPDSHLESPQTSSGPCFSQAAPPTMVPTSFVSSSNRVDWNEHTLAAEFEDVNSGDDFGTYAIETYFTTGMDKHYLHSSRLVPPPSFVAFKTSSGHVNGLPDQRVFAEKPSAADFFTPRLTDARSVDDSPIRSSVASRDSLITDIGGAQELTTASQRGQVSVEHGFNMLNPPVDDYFSPERELRYTNCGNGGVNGKELGKLKKLDSFGRWMDQEIGGDFDDSLMASDSGNYWKTLDPVNGDKEVLIVGTFLGSKKLSNGTKWGCMFGEIEVLAEVLTDNAIRCHAPSHAPGRVSFYITCRNRLACSEVRYFEYRDVPLASVPIKTVLEEEVQLQMCLAKLLNLSPEQKLFICSNMECEECRLKNSICSMMNDCEKDLGTVEETFNSLEFDGERLSSRDKLIQNLLKDKLCEWLLCKVHDGNKALRVMDDEGQGVIHLAAALGYEWAMGLFAAANINPNFRDAKGRTALHWAALFGREGTVIELVRLGADPMTVTDPTPLSPGGQCAADLASSRGHKGIAGYLAEAYLTRQLSSLSVNHNVDDRGLEEKLSAKEPLAAVRRSTQRVALIQQAYNAYSFSERKVAKISDEALEVSLDLAALGSLNKVQKISHYQDYLCSAALKIQQKYRGWKGRKDFLKIRNRIVKIQAHVRGHQVRKQYMKVIWSVSIVEKAILRWRRKGAGLRGFKVEKRIGDVLSKSDKSDEYDFLRISRRQKFAGVEKALARVKSMVRSAEGRDQYMRLVTRFENMKMYDESSSASQQGENVQEVKTEKDFNEI